MAFLQSGGEVEPLSQAPARSVGCPAPGPTYVAHPLWWLQLVNSHIFPVEKLKNVWLFFTRGQFWPSGIVVACVCVSVCSCVRVCINHGLVRTITHHSFKLESPNLEQRCKRPRLRSQLFWGMIGLDLQGQI